jgi:glycosyltransferase involved in cell wall biosynthesis
MGGLLYLVSLYYDKNRVTGANKRFDELGKQHFESTNFKVFVIVPVGQRPEWCPVERAIYISPYHTRLQRLISWLHLTLVLMIRPRGIVYSDFQPVPLFVNLKHKHFQLIHDLRNWTDFGRGGLGLVSSWFQRWQLRSSGKVVTVSEFTKKDITSKCGLEPGAVVVSYNGLTDEYFDRTYSSDQGDRTNDILYVATYEERKNHICLLKAIENLKYDVNVTFIGRDLGSLIELKDYIDNSGSENLKNINFVTSISESDLLSLYRNTRFFVSPSFFEGFGMPLIEAAACGAAVICSDILVFREIMGEDAIYFDPNDYIELSRVLSDSLVGTVVAPSACVDRFKWSSISSDLESEFL